MRRRKRGRLAIALGLMLLTIAFAAPAVNALWTQQALTMAQTQLQANAAAEKAEKTAQNRLLATTDLLPNVDVFATGQDAGSAATHLVGQVTIPKLALVVPLFDTSSPALLQEGAVIVLGTSFPSGDPNTHAVIAAHNGLLGKELFTHLDRLTIGDRFVVTIGTTSRTYAVERRLVVAPDQTDTLRIEPGRELVTLLTCTPYMINSKRLLVTAHRVASATTAAQDARRGAAAAVTWAWARLAALLLVAGGAVGWWVWRRRQKRIRLH
ncbi:class C sortase [Lacticaseibacillus parakribbianus]|uniref:class C sortase n=1 Tax=Lacticaseibacillus parakribbianus TaxID=2970927 RepID=UPI0021CB7EB8|nr:class C sortase [Lacticaseibacillus parakribbianus]